MTALWPRSAKVLIVCALMTVVGSGAPSAGAAGGAHSADGARLSIPSPTGRHPVGVRSTFVVDPSRTDPTTHAPRAIPARVWYPARHRDGPPAPYLSASVQAAIEGELHLPAGLFDIDTHATVAAPARRHVRGVLLFMGGFGTPAALYTGLVIELASRGYAVVAFDHPHETFVVDQPDGTPIPGDLPGDAATFNARLLDVGVVLSALGDLVPEAKPHTAIGIFGHSSGGAAAGEAMLDHPEIAAGVNLDGFIPGGSFLPSGRLLTAGLDRPFGLMLGLDPSPEELQEIATFLSNMRAPHPVRRLDIHHYGFSDFVVFNPQAQRADPAVAAILEATFFTGTLDSLRAGRRALARQREFLVRFFDRYLVSVRRDKRAGGRARGRASLSTRAAAAPVAHIRR